jgi:hypothetical protein
VFTDVVKSRLNFLSVNYFSVKMRFVDFLDKWGLLSQAEMPYLGEVSGWEKSDILTFWQVFSPAQLERITSPYIVDVMRFLGRKFKVFRRVAKELKKALREGKVHDHWTGTTFAPHIRLERWTPFEDSGGELSEPGELWGVFWQDPQLADGMYKFFAVICPLTHLHSLSSSQVPVLQTWITKPHERQKAIFNAALWWFAHKLKRKFADQHDLEISKAYVKAVEHLVSELERYGCISAPTFRCDKSSLPSCGLSLVESVEITGELIEIMNIMRGEVRRPRFRNQSIRCRYCGKPVDDALPTQKYCNYSKRQDRRDSHGCKTLFCRAKKYLVIHKGNLPPEILGLVSFQEDEIIRVNKPMKEIYGLARAYMRQLRLTHLP